MKNLFTVIIALLLPIGVVQAQHMQPDPVTPASKGQLPEMPVIEKAQDGHFAGLQLLHTTLSPFQGVNWDYEAELSFPSPQSLGGENYSLQINRGVAWEAYNEGNTFTGSAYIVYSMGCSYRLKLHGGEKDGWVSNEVAVPPITIPSQKKYTQFNGNQDTFVGSEVRGSSITIYVYHDHSNLNDYTSYKDDASFMRTWYRRNPNTGAMTYTGVSGLTYTVTSDDVGYEIVEVVEGDNKKTDFYYSRSLGVGKFPVFCSAEFFYEGFIVNSEYDIPNPQTFFGFNVYNEETGTSGVTPFAAENFKVLAPGRYAITYPWENYGFGEEVYPTINHFALCEKNEFYPQQFRLWAAPGQLDTKVMQGGQEVEGAKVNLLEKNMDGHMQYVYTSTEGYLNAASYVTLYAKAADVGNGYLPTYYPNALLWTDAQAFDAQEMYHSEEGPQPIKIDVRPAFAALGGQCTIDGKINGNVPVPTPLVSPQDPDIFGTWNFYMTDDDGNPIHTADMLRVKVTINEDGTYVMNIPIWGQVQSGNWSWWNTGTTIQFQVTKLVDRDGGTYEDASLLEHWGVDAEDERVKFRTDISFDVNGNLIMNIFGLPNSVYEPEGGAAIKPAAEPVYVYLRQKGGDIVAATLMQDDGSYHFEKVPYGTYEVIPNIDGYAVSIQSVTLSAEDSAAKGIDYTIGDYIITGSNSGPISVDNISTITNFILGKGTATLEESDINKDGVVNIADIIAAINILLGK